MQRTVLSIAVLLVIGLIVGCGPTREKKEDVIAANKVLDQKFVDAFTARNVDALMATYHNSPDILEIQEDGRVLKGYEAIKAHYQDFFASMESIEGTPIETDYAVYEGCVVGTGRFTMTVKPVGGNPMELSGRYMDVREKHNGQWLFVRNVVVMER
jgi:ketosteroid isomerase-like protein